MVVEVIDGLFAQSHRLTKTALISCGGYVTNPRKKLQGERNEEKKPAPSKRMRREFQPLPFASFGWKWIIFGSSHDNKSLNWFVIKEIRWNYSTFQNLGWLSSQHLCFFLHTHVRYCCNIIFLMKLQKRMCLLRVHQCLPKNQMKSMKSLKGERFFWKLGKVNGEN